MTDDEKCQTCDHHLSEHDREVLDGRPYLLCQLQDCDYCPGFESVANAAERQWEANQRELANG